MNRAHAMTKPSRIIAGGFWRAASALKPSVRAAVLDDYAERLRHASFVGRLFLRLEINREIERRIHAQAPPDALY
jgi:hypothetical protein